MKAVPLLCLALASLPFTVADEDEEPLPQWIWIDAEGDVDEEAWMRGTFPLGGLSIASAEIYASADNHMTLWLNGEEVAKSSNWGRPVQIDALEKLVPGRNAFAVHARNDAGPAAFLLELRLETAGGARVRFRTDGTWRATAEAPGEGWTARGFDDSRWGRPHVLGPFGMAPWGTLGRGFPPESNEALAGERVDVPEGFVVERVYSVPRDEQGSWVALTFDEDGRAITCDQYGALYRVTPEPFGVEALGIELGGAQGLLVHRGALYVVVNEGDRPHGLYRVSASERGGEWDTVELLKEMKGSGEHGPHAVVLSPDREWLYVVAGNHTKLPEGIDVSRVPEVWDEDHLLPRKLDPRGHANGIRAPGGWVARMRLEDERWELVSIGFRNQYDVDFSAEGELFTFDSDMEWDVGLPWYRPTRIVHVVSGADYGWRTGSSKWMPYFADSLPGAADIGLSSPTGVVFGTATDFPVKWRRAFYAADWAYGTIYAVHLEADGASFTGTAEPFVQGRPLPVTDVAVAPDGSLWFTTGGRRTQSGLYRVRWTGRPSSGSVSVASAGALRARKLRRELERFHGEDGGLAAVEAAWPHLAHEDPFVRNAARVAIEHVDAALWGMRATHEEEPAAVIQAAIALARTERGIWKEPVLEALGRLDPAALATDDLLGLLRAYSLVFARMGRTDERDEERLAARFDRVYPSESGDANRELARMLAFLEAPTVVAKTLALLAEAETQEEALHYVYCLRGVYTGWTPEHRAAYFRWFAEDALRYGGGASFRAYVDGLRDDALATLPGNERAAVEALLAEGAAALAESLPTPEALPFVRKWTKEDAQPLLAQLDEGRDFESGRKAFVDATCIQCHRIAGAGGADGPDLTGAGRRFSPSDLVDALLTPSATISDQYQDTLVVTNDDRVLVGRVQWEDEKTLALRGRPPYDQVVEVALADVVSREPDSVSRMPEGLVDVLTEDQLLDLMGYVLAGGDASDPRFATEDADG